MMIGSRRSSRQVPPSKWLSSFEAPAHAAAQARTWFEILAYRFARRPLRPGLCSRALRYMVAIADVPHSESVTNEPTATLVRGAAMSFRDSNLLGWLLG